MSLDKFKAWCKENIYSLLIIVSAFLGLIAGFILKSIWTISPTVLTYIGLPGTLIIRAFLMIIVPLIIVSLSTSITATKRGENRRLIVITFLLIVIFASFVSIFGVILISIFKPGVTEKSEDVVNTNDKHITNNKNDVKQMISSQDEAIYDVFINLIPDNIIAAAFMSHYTALVPIDVHNLTLGYKKVSQKAFKSNMLGLCVFSLMLGFAILHLDSKAQTIKRVLEETNAIIMQILATLIKIMPIGMFFWMCVEAIKMKSPEKVLVQLSWFFGTALLAYALIWFLVYPGIYFLIVRKNPFKMYLNIIPAMIVAFGSCSSAITLPVTMQCMEDKNHLPKSVSHFVLPLAMTMHMPGASMFYPMVTLFVAQMHAVHIPVQLIITLCIYTTIMSMAFPGAPSGGSSVVYFMTTCALIGIDNPMDVLAYIMTLEWLSERIRTMTNITGDCIIASIVQKLCRIENEKIIQQVELSINAL